MTFDKPAWITKEFLKKAIQNGDDSLEVSVESFEVDMPVPKGNNYGSTIYGVKAKYTKSNDLTNLHELSIIIKGQIDCFLSDVLHESGATDKESMVYKELAPKLELLFSGNNKNHEDEDNTVLPKSYFSTQESAVIVEDLKCKGYRMVDKVEMLDFDHCATALRALAKFHAGSILIQEKEPELIKKLSKDIVENKTMNDWYSSLMKTTFQVTSEEFKKLPDFKKYSRWFDENAERIGHLSVDNLSKSKENELKVLNHGDFHLTNMLFKKTDNEPLKVKLIDLQCCRYTSPVVDFLYFVDSSAQDDVWLEKFDDLIKIYLSEFNSILKRYGNTKRQTESEFKKSIADRPYLRLFMSTNFLPMLLADPKEVYIIDREEFTQDLFADTEKTPIRTYIKNPKYLNTISKRLCEFEKTGLITI